MLTHFFIEPNVSRRAQVIRGLVAFALCASLVSILAYEGWRTCRVGHWPEASCTITASRVVDRRDMAHEANPYVFEVAYQYEWAGRRRHGERFSPDYFGSDQAAEAYALARAYPVGLRTTCRVNPADPGQSELREASSRTWAVVVAALGGLSLLMTVFYVVPQVFACAATWVFGPAGPAIARAFAARTVSCRRSNADLLAAGVFCALLLGVSTLWGVFPILRASRAAATWTPTPCRVVSSVVVKHDIHAGEGAVVLFRADVLYRYDVAGREYFSNAHCAWDGPSPFYATGKRAITLEYPPGTAATCYVDPHDPADAVLDTGVSAPMLVALVPGALGVILAAWIAGEVRGSARTAKACGVLAALVGSGVAGLLFVVVMLDVVKLWRAGRWEIWGGAVAVLLLAATGWAGYGFAQARRAYASLRVPAAA